MLALAQVLEHGIPSHDTFGRVFAALNPRALSTIDAISAGYGVSKNHLRKVVHDLSRHGFIETVQGRNGGIRLSKPAEEIPVGTVLRKMEQDMCLVECFDPPTNTCRIVGACALRSMLHDSLAAFLANLAALEAPAEKAS